MPVIEDFIFLASQKTIMDLSKQIAKHLRSLYFGKNWTAVSYKEALEDISWEEANRKNEPSI